MISSDFFFSEINPAGGSRANRGIRILRSSANINAFFLLTTIKFIFIGN